MTAAVARAVAGAEARPLLLRLIGTAEAVPCYKTRQVSVVVSQVPKCEAPGAAGVCDDAKGVKSKCGFFAYHPQTEVRLGARALSDCLFCQGKWKGLMEKTARCASENAKSAFPAFPQHDCCEHGVIVPVFMPFPPVAARLAGGVPRGPWR